jgi:8-oxo-dGTP pyrophosphatase MutT (NUDIX family)
MEHGHVAATLKWLAEARRPLDRHTFDPGHAVASAFVVSDHGEVALIHHGRLRRWLQPGGHAEPGEAEPRTVAAREVSEELGLAVEPQQLELFDVDRHVIPQNPNAPEHWHFDLRFLVRVGHTALRAGSDAAEARWVGNCELEQLSLDLGLRRMVAKARTRRLIGRHAT